MPIWFYGRSVMTTPVRSVGRDRPSFMFSTLVRPHVMIGDITPDMTPFYQRLCLSYHHLLPHPPDSLPTWVPISSLITLFHLTCVLILSAGMMCRRAWSSSNWLSVLTHLSSRQQRGREPSIAMWLREPSLLVSMHSCLHFRSALET